MRIHHYTTVDTLALILKNKTIRFTRLDKVDDLEENACEKGVKIGKYSFASCWTISNEESIPQWKLYTAVQAGVRITLDWNMFKIYDNKVYQEFNGIKVGTENSPLERTITPLHDFFSSKNAVFPVSDKELPYFFRKIKYVNDVSLEVKNIVDIIHHSNKIDEIRVSPKNLGLYKNKRWEFQEECRFVLFIVPGNDKLNTPNFISGFNDMLYIAWSKGIEPSIVFYDMQLRDDIFDTMEITLSPNILESQKIIVDSLVRTYAPQAIIKESNLCSKVRLK